MGVMTAPNARPHPVAAAREISNIYNIILWNNCISFAGGGDGGDDNVVAADCVMISVRAQPRQNAQKLTRPHAARNLVCSIFIAHVPADAPSPPIQSQRQHRIAKVGLGGLGVN